MSTKTTTLRSDEFTCPSCVSKIEKKLESVSGVSGATVHFTARSAANIAQDGKGYIEDRRPNANIDPYVEEYVCTKMGLKPEPVSTQVIPRDRHAEYFCTLAVIASSMERIAVEVRHRPVDRARHWGRDRGQAAGGQALRQPGLQDLRRFPGGAGAARHRRRPRDAAGPLARDGRADDHEGGQGDLRGKALLP